MMTFPLEWFDSVIDTRQVLKESSKAWLAYNCYLHYIVLERTCLKCLSCCVGWRACGGWNPRPRV